MEQRDIRTMGSGHRDKVVAAAPGVEPRPIWCEAHQLILNGVDKFHFLKIKLKSWLVFLRRTCLALSVAN